MRKLYMAVLLMVVAVGCQDIMAPPTDPSRQQNLAIMAGHGNGKGWGQGGKVAAALDTLIFLAPDGSITIPRQPGIYGHIHVENMLGTDYVGPIATMVQDGQFIGNVWGGTWSFRPGDADLTLTVDTQSLDGFNVFPTAPVPFQVRAYFNASNYWYTDSLLVPIPEPEWVYELHALEGN